MADNVSDFFLQRLTSWDRRPLHLAEALALTVQSPERISTKGTQMNADTADERR